MGNIAKILSSYQYRQIVINTYEDEELVDRNGFYFDIFESTSSMIQFYKNSSEICTLSIRPSFTIQKSNQFPNYFLIKEADELKHEIYFP